jgi:hypothetical protein
VAERLRVGSREEQVTEEYAKNPALVAALAGITRRREGLTGSPVDTIASYRADLSRGAPWKVAGVRFFVVSVTKGDPRPDGPVFEAADGTRSSFDPPPRARRPTRWRRRPVPTPGSSP